MNKLVGVVILLIVFFAPRVLHAAFTIRTTPAPRIPTLSELLPKPTPLRLPNRSLDFPPNIVTSPLFPRISAPYNPLRFSSSLIGNITSPTPIPKAAPKKPKALEVSTADRNAKDFIPDRQVPFVVERMFGEVFGVGRKISVKESKYWKFRARTDKATESKLRDTMKYFLSKEITYISF